MSDRHRVEASGETVGEAKWQALRELERMHPGLDKAAVSFQVVSEGERGLLGVGYTPARVVAAVDPSATEAREPQVVPADESELASVARAVLERITRALGIPTQIEIVEDEESLTASCSGGDVAILIGKHGQTIDAVQYLLNAILFRAYPEQRKPVVVDAAGYRERRRATLDALAQRSAKDAIAAGKPVALEPMTAVERKVVHESVKELEGVETSSEGTEPNRFVVITPTGA